MGTIEKISVKWGVAIFICLTGYFFLMKAVGLVHNMELRLLNGVFMFGGLYFAIRQVKQSVGEFTYFKGIGTGLLTAITASLLFSFFALLYLTIIDPAFMGSIKVNEPFGRFMNEYSASFQIFIEGAASGCGLTFAVMQRLKQPHMSSPVKVIQAPK